MSKLPVIAFSDGCDLDSVSHIVGRLVGCTLEFTTSDGLVHSGEVVKVAPAAGIPSVWLQNPITGASRGAISLNAVTAITYC